jgi:amidase
MIPTTAAPAAHVGLYEGAGALETLLKEALRWPGAYTPAWNMSGQPAAAVPAGFDDTGLPLSVQLVGRANDERTLLSLAAQLEAARPWADRRPALA